MEKRKIEKRRKDEDLFKVVDSTLDPKTYVNLENIASRLDIETYLGSISSGKEAKIYPARTYDGKYYAVKIYYVSTASHKRAVERYTLGDQRFEKIKISNTRQLIYTWARKEFKNLKRMHEAGVRVPEPVLVYENILVMQFIGENGVRAPLLKELPDEEIDSNLYNDVISQLQIIVNKAKLVHGDLSEYNIMVYDGIYIIDVSQSVPVDHENAIDFLIRDINNINQFFESKGLSTIDTEEILKTLEIPNREE